MTPVRFNGRSNATLTPEEKLVQDRNKAGMAAREYQKPEVYNLGSVRELTNWTKLAGSADAWGQQQGTAPKDEAQASFSGGH